MGGIPIRRFWCRLAIIPMFMLALLVTFAPSASAHAFLLDSNPADGASLATAPSEIRLQFSESVAVDAMQLDLVNGAGQHLATGPVRLEDTAADADPEEPVAVVVDLPVLVPDAYRLNWRTLSSDDLHVTNGVIVFGVGQQVTASGLQEPLPGTFEVILRAVIFLCLSLALGGLLACVLLRRSAPALEVSRAARRCARLAAIGALFGAVSVTVLVGGQIMSTLLSPLAVINTAFLTHFALRAGGFVMLAIAAVVLGRARGVPAGARWTVAVGAAAVGIGTALMGHPAAAGRVSVTRVVADGTHLLAAATWAGVLFLAVFIALPLARRTGPAAVHSALVAFAPPALVCFGLLVVTGFYLASSAVVSVDAAIGTFYGRSLLLKLTLVAGLAVLGLINHRLLRDGTGRVRTGPLVAEGALLASVLVLAAVLTSSQPAMESAFVRTSSGDQVDLRDGIAGDLQEALTVRPNVPGANVVLVTAADTRRPSPGPVRRVLVSIVGPASVGTPVVAERVDVAQWSASTDIREAGEFEIQVTVQRDGLPDVVSRYPWRLAAAGGAAEATPWTAPIADVLVAVSLVALIVMALLGVGWSVRRSRRRSSGVDPVEHVDRGELAGSGSRR